MIDWSLDDNREHLRESVQGREKEIAELFDAEGALMLEFVQQVGIGQYTHYLFVEWLAENYPECLAQAAGDLTTVSDVEPTDEHPVWNTQIRYQAQAFSQ